MQWDLFASSVSKIFGVSFKVYTVSLFLYMSVLGDRILGDRPIFCLTVANLGGFIQHWVEKLQTLRPCLVFLYSFIQFEFVLLQLTLVRL